MTPQQEQAAFRTIIEDYLFPMFPGMAFDAGAQPQPAPRSRKLVSWVGGRIGFKIKPMPTSNYVYVVRRSQAFARSDLSIVTNLVEEMVGLLSQWSKPYRQELASALMSRIVARSAEFLVNADFVAEVIDVLTEWAQQTYEGQRITVSVGIRNWGNPVPGPTFRDAVAHDFAKVITNGHDTLLCCKETGEIIEHLQLPVHTGTTVYAPYPFVPLAEWTKTIHAVAIVLNRNGEILVFSHGELSFAKRRGKWRYFSHKAAVTQLANRKLGNEATEKSLREAVYLTALDVAFSRGGGCIGLEDRHIPPNAQGGHLLSVTPPDLLSSGGELRTVVKRALVADRKFQDIDRRLRQELTGIDGATVLDGRGNILATGAILTITGGSSGGARKAAAIELGNRGIGVKISSDGDVKVFSGGSAEPFLQFG